jgi:hypothetical protein
MEHNPNKLPAFDVFFAQIKNTAIAAAEATSDMVIATSLRNYFDVLVAAKTPLIIDLRYESDIGNGGEYVGKRADTKADFLTTLREGTQLRENADDRSRHSFSEVKYTDKRDRVHNFIHFAVRDLPDNWAPTMADTVKLMRKICGISERLGTDNVVIHCNCGLGRAPTVASFLTLWRAAKRAKEKNLELVYDESRQSQLEIDGKLNMAAVLHRIHVQGNFARSTFILTQKQLDTTVDFARCLAAGKIPMGKNRHGEEMFQDISFESIPPPVELFSINGEIGSNPAGV